MSLSVQPVIVMICFCRRTFWESLKYKFLRSYREECDRKTRAAIEQLIKHLEEPCMIEGQYIPNGYGDGTHPFNHSETMSILGVEL